MQRYTAKPPGEMFRQGAYWGPSSGPIINVGCIRPVYCNRAARFAGRERAGTFLPFCACIRCGLKKRPACAGKALACAMVSFTFAKWPHRQEQTNRQGTQDGRKQTGYRPVPEAIPYLAPHVADGFCIGGEAPLTYQQGKRACERIRKGISFPGKVTPRRFRPTVLTDLYAQTKDIKNGPICTWHTAAAMALKHYVNGRNARTGTAASVASAYGLSAVKVSAN